MVTNISFPSYMTAGDLKDFLDKVPSNALVELYFPLVFAEDEKYKYIERRFIIKGEELFELTRLKLGRGIPRNLVETDVLKIGRMNTENVIKNS